MDLAMAQRLVDRRKAAGLSQEALAAQLGVSRQAVSKWERSESSPDTDNLIALAALYGVSLDELLYGEAVDSTDDSQADDEAQNSNAGTKASDKAEEAEVLLNTLIAAISHLSIFPSRAASTLLTPTKAKRFMLAGMASMWLTSARVKRSMWGQADCISIRLRTMDIVCIPMTTAPSPSTARRFQLEGSTRQARPSRQAFPHQGRTCMEQIPLPCACRPRLSGARHCLRHMGYGTLPRLSDSRLLRAWRLYRPTPLI